MNHPIKKRTKSAFQKHEKAGVISVPGLAKDSLAQAYDLIDVKSRQLYAKDGLRLDVV